MREDQKYIADSLRTTGIGLIVGGIIGRFTGRIELEGGLILMVLGAILMVTGYIYVRRRIAR